MITIKVWWWVPRQREADREEPQETVGAGSVLLIHPGGDYVRACSVVHFYVIFVCVIFHKRLFKGKKKKPIIAVQKKETKAK